MSDHLVQHIKHRDLVHDNTLHVIGVVSNPMRFESRVRLFREWEKEMLSTPHVKLYLVELAYNDMHFELTDAKNPHHLQLHSHQIIWHKENMINLAVRHLLPKDAKYICWCDADIHFRNPGWALETIHQLQLYPVVQPWSDCIDLGFRGNIVQHFESFCSIHRKEIRKQRWPGEPYKYAHSGFAWACTRYFWENVKGLMDFPILGSADHHMAWAMIGDVKSSVHGGMSQSFKDRANRWQADACRVTYGDSIGYVMGRIEHHFHGPKAKRKYRERWQIFIDNKFDPDQDLAYDSNGLLYVLNKPRLLQDIKEYFIQRSEDEISN